jgi:hypothetical protein
MPVAFDDLPAAAPPSAAPDQSELGGAWATYPTVEQAGPPASAAPPSPADVLAEASQYTGLGTIDPSLVLPTLRSAATGATLGLSRPLTSVLGATYEYGKEKLPAGGDVPQKSWGELYEQQRQQQQQSEQQFAREHPLAAGGGTLGGAGALALATAGTSVLPEVASLGGRALLGMGLGGGAGAVMGGTEYAPTWQRKAGDIAEGGGVGALTGAIVPYGGELAHRLIGAPLARVMSRVGGWLSPEASEFISPVPGQATDIIKRRVAADQAAGQAAQQAGVTAPRGAPIGTPMTPAPPVPVPATTPNLVAGGALMGQPTLEQRLTAGEMLGRPVSVADVGGRGVTGLLGQTYRAGGAAGEFIDDVLGQRDALAGTRLMGDIRDRISNGASPYEASQQLMAQRDAAAKPLYQQAIFDNTGAPRQITDPALQDYVAGAKPLRDAMNAIKAANPDFKDVPFTDMRLLDQAYKAIGTRTFGATDPVQEYNLNQIRGRFGDLLTKANPDYQAALDAFSGPMNAQRAIDQGGKIFEMDPGETRDYLAGLPVGDRDFFQVGAAKAIGDRFGGMTGGNEAARVVGSPQTQAQLRPLFGTQGEFDDFMNRAAAEGQLFKTRLAAGITGASRTSEFEQASRPPGGDGLMSGLGHLGAAVGLMTQGPTGALASIPLWERGLRVLGQPGSQTYNPEVSMEIARRLLATGQGARQTLADVMAAPGPRNPAWTLPAAGLAGQTATPPGRNTAVGWGANFNPLVP